MLMLEKELLSEIEARPCFSRPRGEVGGALLCADRLPVVVRFSETVDSPKGNLGKKKEACLFFTPFHTSFHIPLLV